MSTNRMERSDAAQDALPSNLRIGDAVGYVLREGRSAGQERASTVVRMWDAGVVNLQVHLDGSNDAGAEGTMGDVMTAWVTSVPFGDEQHDPGTWHRLGGNRRLTL